MIDPEVRAARARQLLDDPLLQEAIASIKTEAMQAWENTAARDTEAREIAWLTVKVANRITAALEGMVDDGKIAAKRTQVPLR